MKKTQLGMLILLAAVNFTHILDFMIMMPLGNYLMPVFEINPQEFTYLVAAYTVSAAVSGFVAAFFVDRFDRRSVLLFGYIGFIVGTLACALADTYAILLISRIVAGLFGGLIGAQVLSIISDTFPYERRGAAMGAVMSSFSIASTLGVPFSLYLAKWYGWHAPFFFVVGLGVIVIPLLLILVPSMKGHIQPGASKAFRFDVLTDVLSSSLQRKALLLTGLIMMGHFLIIPFINPYMEFNNGYTKDQTPLIYLVGGICAFFASNILGPISDRWGKLRIFTICILLSLPMMILITQMPPIDFRIVLVAFGFWFIVATGRGVTVQAMVSNVVPAEKRGGFMSFNSSLQQLGTGIASMVAGAIVTQPVAKGPIVGYPWLGYLSVAVLLVCAALAWSIFRENKETATLKLEQDALTTLPLES